MRLTKTLGWSLGAGLLCLALVVGSWFVLVSPQRARAAEARELTSAAQDRNASLALEIERLQLEYADLGSRQAELAAIRQALPDAPALASLIRQFDDTADAIGVELVAVTAGVPVAVSDPDDPAGGTAPGAAPADGATAEGGANAGDGAEGADADGADADGADAEGADAEGAQAGEDATAGGEAAEGATAGGDASTTAQPGADPAPGTPEGAATAPAGPVLAAIDVSTTMTGDYGSVALALQDVQATMPRAFLVESVAVDVLTEDDQPPGTVELVVTGRVFVFVDDQAELAGLDVTDPGIVDPDLVDPGLDDLGADDPSLAEPDDADAGPADPGFGGPGTGEQDAVDPDLEATEPGTAVVGAGPAGAAEQEGTP